MTRSRSNRRRQAFTLLELMIVLVILVLLFAMVGPKLLGSQKKADIKAAKTQIGNLESALELYAVDMRTFPSSEDGLQALLEPPSDERAAAKWDGPYLDDVLPVDPWENAYEYEYPPTRNTARDFPDIWSLGPDGEADTDDDIGNWREGSGEGGAEDGTTQDRPTEDRSGKTRERPPTREPSSGGARERAGGPGGGGGGAGAGKTK
jgi:general secretion pathway protein G